MKKSFHKVFESECWSELKIMLPSILLIAIPEEANLVVCQLCCCVVVQIVETVGASRRLMNAQLAKIHLDSFPAMIRLSIIKNSIKTCLTKIKEHFEVADQSSHLTHLRGNEISEAGSCGDFFRQTPS